MFPRFKALRSCDSDVLLPQQAHDDRLGHRCHEIPLPWTCHDLLWVAQCWLLPIDALCLTDFHKLPCFQCTGSCPVTLQVLCPKSSSLPAFGLRKQQQGELGHEWQAGAVWGGRERGLVSMTTSTPTGFLRPFRPSGVHRHCWDDLPRSPQGQRFGDVTQGWGSGGTNFTTERWIHGPKFGEKQTWHQ